MSISFETSDVFHDFTNGDVPNTIPNDYDGDTIAAKIGDEVAGIIRVGHAPGSRIWKLTDLYVYPKHRGKGIAAALVTKATETVEDGLLWLWVPANNHTAQNLYRSLGYIEEPPPDYVRDLVYRRDWMKGRPFLYMTKKT